MQDADGVTVTTGSTVWYDDGHSPDWVHGTITGFPLNPQNSAAIRPDAGGNNVVVVLTLVHVNKPLDPPDR